MSKSSELSQDNKKKNKRSISKEREKKLRKLAKLFNKQSVNPAPILKDILICMDIAITPEETDFLLMVGENHFNYEQLRSLTDISDEKFNAIFESTRHKGMLNTRYGKNGDRIFKLAPMIPSGWFDDTYLSDGEESPEKREFAYYFDQAVTKLEKLNFFPLRPIVDLYSKKSMKNVNTIIAINPPESEKKSIEIDQTVDIPLSNIYPTPGVYDLIEKYGDSIGVKHCFCTQWRKMVGDECDFDLPSERCISLGDNTRKYTETGVGRSITKEEAYRIVEESQKSGAIHTVFYMDEDLNKSEVAICNCCWDCCGVYRLYNTGAQPLLLKSFYYASLNDESLCNGCGKCEKYCPVNTIHLSDKMAVIDKDKCIGCGQCAYQCPQDAIQLVFQEREVYVPIQKKSECRL